MPNSTQDSSDSQPPSATPSDSVAPMPGSPPLAWRTNLWLFLATVASVFVTGAINDPAPLLSRTALAHGAQFCGALLAILLAHEFGHFIAARIHKVDATLPFFIPMPLLSPFGTMGAVIRMRGVIATRAALLDIGASGPLAGMVVAIPMYIWGVRHSTPVAIEGIGDSMSLGESLLTRALDHFVAPAIEPGMDLMYSPIAFAAWAGMFVTMINLIPIGQLDAGHVAYALFGPRQDRIAQWVHRSMLAFFFVSLISYALRDLRAGIGLIHIDRHVGNSLFWLIWFEMGAILGALSARALPASAREERTIPIRTRIVATIGLALVASFGRGSHSPLLWIGWFVSLGLLLAMEVKWGALRKNNLLDHPPTSAAPLGIGRTIVAIITLLLFILLFMPTPIAL